MSITLAKVFLRGWAAMCTKEWALWWGWFTVPPEISTITRLELYCLLTSIVGPFSITSCLATFFLIDDTEEIRGEDLVSLNSAPRLLVNTRAVPPLVLHLHAISHFLLSSRNQWLPVLRWTECTVGLIWVDLPRIIHAYLVHPVVALTRAIYLAEDEFSKRSEADRVPSFVLPHQSV